MTTAQAATAISRLLVMMGSMMMRMPVDTVRHMMPRVVVRLVVGVMDGGRSGRIEHQRGRNDNSQSCDNLTHRRLHEECFQ
jgi:hypothetical protein